MDIKHIAEQIASSLHATSIVCYGSWADKTADDKSDIDLLVVMASEVPDCHMRRLCYEALERVTVLELDKSNTGGWDNSWSPVNDKIQIKNQIIEIGYNRASWVLEVVDNLINKHSIHFSAFPFRPYTFLGLLETCQILFDRDNFIQSCRSRLRPIPLELKQAIIREYFPILLESVQDLGDCSERCVGIIAYLFFLERSIDAAIQILFVINDIYDPASKRIEGYLKQLKTVPPNLFFFLEELLPRFYENRGAIDQFFKEVIQFVNKFSAMSANGQGL
ncbi:MAG: nucleotidyltransferase domain-containing protein [Verrucomicrobia bacterium]|nr:nucleotidyltransferase domain-containing protein [Verrucomicrobiota bacterium]